MPYCPICKAEFRTGFAQCCHCLAKLVGSPGEAEAAKVVLLWEGLSRHQFEAIVAALRGANIPNRARCGSDAEKSSSNPLSHMMKMKAKNQGSWQVSVLEADYERARSIARSCC